MKKRIIEFTAKVYKKLYPTFNSATVKESQIAVMNYIQELRKAIKEIL